jgi:AcrR family transcriptional regulator
VNVVTVKEPQPRRETTADRRKAIAEAARLLILEMGVEGLRTRDIADRVGINVATLHYHVPTKEALIGLVAETVRDDFRNQSLLRPRTHLNPAERLEHEFYDVREMYFDRPDVIAVMSELMERGRRDPVVKAAIRPILGRWREMVADILADGVADGTFRSDLDPVAGAHIFVGSIIGFWRGSDGTLQFFERLCDELRRALRSRT